jgi:hypothetical protein
MFYFFVKTITIQFMKIEFEFISVKITIINCDSDKMLSIRFVKSILTIPDLVVVFLFYICSCKSHNTLHLKLLCFQFSNFFLYHM